MISLSLIKQANIRRLDNTLHYPDANPGSNQSLLSWTSNTSLMKVPLLIDLPVLIFYPPKI